MLGRGAKNVVYEAMGKLKHVGQKIKSSFGENKRLNKEASKMMDEKYPAGWAQSPTNMTELNLIVKSLKNKK